MTHSRSDIASLLEANGLSPRRAFGQNFVVDPNIVRKIARLSGVGPGDHVVEIGAGLGSLTLALAETGAHVLAVEIDNGVVEVLREVVANCDNVEVLHADAGELDWNSLAKQSQSWHVVANLPYIPTAELRTLQDEVQREPSSALDGGPDGLDIIRRLVAEASEKLRAGGRLALDPNGPEVGPAGAWLRRAAIHARSGL